MPSDLEILTVGHSTHTFERFFDLLAAAGVTAIADVRSAPYSRHQPHFSQRELQARLKEGGISYVFLGRELGGRPARPDLFCEGVADYEKMARTPEFAEGLARVEAGARRYRIALMCSEQDPLDCHRCLLVGRALAAKGIGVRHLLSNGELRDQARIEEDLLDLAKLDADDLFAPRDERLAAAYRARGRRVAFAEPVPEQAAGGGPSPWSM